MKNEQIYLNQLIDSAEIKLKGMELPYTFNRRLNKDPTRKFKGNIMDYFNVPIHYKLINHSSLSIELLCEICINLHSEIIIEFYEPCWRIECLYRIFNSQIESWINYNCYLDEYPELDKAMKNIEFVIKYYELNIKDPFVSFYKLQNNSIVNKENE